VLITCEQIVRPDDGKKQDLVNHNIAYSINFPLMTMIMIITIIIIIVINFSLFLFVLSFRCLIAVVYICGGNLRYKPSQQNQVHEHQCIEKWGEKIVKIYSAPPPSSEDGNRSSFRKVMFSSF
jgi:hypothetical protein